MELELLRNNITQNDELSFSKYLTEDSFYNLFDTKYPMKKARIISNFLKITELNDEHIISYISMLLEQSYERLSDNVKYAVKINCCHNNMHDFKQKFSNNEIRSYLEQYKFLMNN